MIEVSNLSFSIGNFNLKANLSVGKAEYFVLLGSTGSGKTMLLENICGLKQPGSGTLLINDSDMTRTEPRHRKIGYVPQDGALFPHLNVTGNIAFSLDVARVKKRQRAEAVQRIAEMLGIVHLLTRKIRGLSGGERQRVALARALVGNPAALVLDEPVSALDEHTRECVCRELRRLQGEMRLPVIHVCHSFEEARLVADRVGIMENGSIIQTGTPEELINQPGSLAVARILRLENILDGSARYDKERSVYTCGEAQFFGPPANGAVKVYIPPWAIGLGPENDNSSCTTVSGTIDEIDNRGTAIRCRATGVLPLVFYLSRREFYRERFTRGDEVTLSFPQEAVHVLEAQ